MGRSKGAQAPTPTPTSRRELGRDGLVRVSEYRCPLEKGAPTEPEQFTSTSITLVRSGVFGFRSERGPQLLTAGFAMLANPGQQYEISHEHAGGDRCIIFHIDEALLEEAVGSAPRGAPRRYFARSVLPPLPRVEALRHLAEQRLSENGPALGLEELGLALAASIGAQLGRAPRSEVPRDSRTARDSVQAALAEIEHGSADELRLGDLARVAGLSPYHFLRVFKRETGVTPHRFLTQVRVRRAIELLRDTSRPVTEIALDVGFGDLSNFINTFRREVGCSPARFRKTTPEDWAATVLATRAG
ncbi:helix-turn-helix transcriptional regulator [Pyxidicoccus fallax]|uniref:Helix-turn-helix transcriptional regulator n=1 Tax=Pyxidicoccus fallax TaxID=394095 RepID=A0A848LDA0_9BACT|nr:AraC family transcriptional regulator [Pyxidicoccus fallax]NMO16677.1 helix-turn-helix transcriptional regulator [Pyxidicoccus fallax]NPC79242.1 helix-turn-helix transcriptional regulator [Pyxidicoccus fallax]